MVDHPDRAARLGAALMLAAALVGCAAVGASPAPSGRPASESASSLLGAASALDSASPSPAPTTAPTTASTAAPPVTPSPMALPGSPPGATLTGLSGGDAAGALGSYTWAGGGSDSPWIVSGVAGTANPGARLQVAFGGPVPAGWTASWARVVDGSASPPMMGTSGVADPTLVAPVAAGAWTIRVTASFGPGASATYYWRLTVTP